MPTGFASDGEIEDHAVDILSEVTLSVNPAVMDEDADGTLDFAFARTGDTSDPLTVHFDIGGTANSVDD